MKNQRICIIGDGLAGITASLAFKNTSLDVDLYHSGFGEAKLDKRITAISESNLAFLKQIEKKINLKLFRSCDKINLYYETNNKIFNFLNFNEDNLMHIFENDVLKKNLIKLIKTKDINLIKKKITNINYKNSFIKINNTKRYYDLIILCLGARSDLYYNLTKDRSIKKDYKEVAITGYVNHNSKLNNPRQYFLKQGPLAFLPFDKKKFSFVWSLDKKYYINNTKNLKIIVANKINELLRKKNNFKISKIFSYPIHLNLQKKYYKNNVLILGEGLHSIHPIAGQGFNLVLRDIKKLKKLINKNLKLGLTLKNSYLFKEFCDTRKPENVIFGLGIDLTNSFFKQNKYLDPFKEIIIKNVSKMSSLKKFSKLFSDKGFTI
tara:strand:+ start:208 stop:1341 length:1134 start_codon:yes stop_codon:yes gene_type:complete